MNELSSAYSMRSCPSSSISHRRQMFVIWVVKECFAHGQGSSGGEAVGNELRGGHDRGAVHDVADAVEPSAVGRAQALRGDIRAERDERTEERVLDDVLALLVGDELVDQLLHCL